MVLKALRRPRKSEHALTPRRQGGCFSKASRDRLDALATPLKHCCIYILLSCFYLQGHRLKNSKCKLLSEMKRIPMDNKLLLTGTPLQNNLAELWSLLNFILPDIFSSHQEFESWYNSPCLSYVNLSILHLCNSI
jgi:hypothetical protein